MNILMPASAVQTHLQQVQHLRYRPDIDGLRAIAIIPVVLFHAFPDALPGGFIGVDVFFVISGFLITSIIVQENAAGRFSLLNFYSRRIRRIFPALVATLAATIAIGWMILLEGEFHQLMWHVFAGATFWQNIALLNEAGYFDRLSETKPLLHLWSLAVEEQFYIVLPLIIGLASRIRGKPILSSLAALAALSLVMALFTIQRHPDRAFYLPHLRAWELLAGSCLALALPSRNLCQIPRWIPETLAALSLAGIIAGVFLIEESDSFPGWIAMIPVISAAALIGTGPDTWLGRNILGSRPLVAIGLISFPLYLWHWPVLVYLRLAFGTAPPAIWQLAAVALSTALAMVTYLSIERPIRSNLLAKHTSKVVGGLTIAMLVLAAMGVLGSRGMFDHVRAPEFSMNRENFGWEGDYETQQCRDSYPGLKVAKFCNFSGRGAPTVALLGDSHALVFYSGLDAELKKQNEILVNFGGPSCLPTIAAPFHSTGNPLKGSSNCTGTMDEAYKVVLGTPSIHTVYLSSRRFVTDMPALARNAAVLSYRRSAELLLAAGKRVIFVLDFPEQSIDPATCIRPFNLIDDEKACIVPLPKAVADRQMQEDLLREALKPMPEIPVLDPFDSLCAEGACPFVIDGQALYRDGNHLSEAGSAHVAKQLADALSRDPRSADH